MTQAGERLLRLLLLATGMAPDDTRIVSGAQSGPAGLYIVPADGSTEPVAITDASVARREVQWSPNGEWLAFARFVLDETAPTASIAFMRVDGSDERFYDTQTQAGDATAFADGGVRWSPDWSRGLHARRRKPGLRLCSCRGNTGW